MDHRKRIPPGSLLPFPGMVCHVEDTIGAGSNAIVYQGWYTDHLSPGEKHHVLIKELFPLHERGGIRRDESGDICVESGDAQDFFDLHRQSFETGNRIHLRLLSDHPDQMGGNVNSFALHHTLYTVLGFSGGVSLESALSQCAPGLLLRRCTQWMLGLLRALDAFHLSGYLHLDISPDNILLLDQGRGERVMLIDYNSARPIGDLSFPYLSCKPGYCAPEAELGEAEELGAATDLYSVAAVFFRCLAGRRLTPDEQLRPDLLPAAEYPLLRDAPQTVISLALDMLQRGLHPLPEERYASAEDMARSFTELLDRIDRVGVTHWALWEAGRQRAQELVRTNPSLHYLLEEDNLYPIRLSLEGTTSSWADFSHSLAGPDGTSCLTVSPGGMGKTTLLLRCAMEHSRFYSPRRSAAFYLSLSAWQSGDHHFLRTQLFSSLRMKRAHNTFPSALQALQELLCQPLPGGAPVLLLLLDGLNEIQGDAALMEEISTLARYPGVRILAASRSEHGTLSLPVCSLLRLGTEDIERAAQARGVMLPQSASLMELMKTPLILSLYLQAAGETQQLQLSTQEELMQAYLEALYQKEIRALEENDPLRWQLDAALHFVLPAIAAQARRAGHALTQAQMLPVLQRCYRVIASPLLQRAFPQWIGRSRHILGAAASAEEWYGLMVHDLLWQRLGLLMRDGEGQYRVFHQTFADHLAQLHRRTESAIRRMERRGRLMGAMAAMLVCLAGFGVYAQCWMPVPYEEDMAEAVVGAAVQSYRQYQIVYQEMTDLLDIANRHIGAAAQPQWTQERLGWVTLSLMRSKREMNPFEAQYADTLEALSQGSPQDGKSILADLSALAGQSRGYVPWSGLPVDGPGLSALHDHLWKKCDEYAHVFLPQLKTWYLGDGQYAAPSEKAYRYIEEARGMLHADAQAFRILYLMYLAPHVLGERFTDLKGWYAFSLDGDPLAMPVDADDLPAQLEAARLSAARHQGNWNGLMELFEPYESFDLFKITRASRELSRRAQEMGQQSPSDASPPNALVEAREEYNAFLDSLGDDASLDSFLNGSAEDAYIDEQVVSWLEDLADELDAVNELYGPDSAADEDLLSVEEQLRQIEEELQKLQEDVSDQIRRSPIDLS